MYRKKNVILLMAAMLCPTLFGCEELVGLIDDLQPCQEADDSDCCDSEGEADSEDWGDSEDSNLSVCELGLTCAGLENPEDCIADFGLGTNQAGYPPDGYSNYIGFYAFNDGSGGTMTPVPNPYVAEPAEQIQSCDSRNNYALHLEASGFTTWGVGIGMNWGGTPNESCEVDGAMNCLQISYDDQMFDLEDAEEDPCCEGCEAEAKLNCLKLGKNILQPKDLSAYAGIGFWMMATDSNEAETLKVTFPIAETMRFYGGADGCNDDNDDNSDDCFNDFYTTIGISNSDAGKWIYHEILFGEIHWNEWWGLQLDTIGITDFPSDRSMGIKFMIEGNATSPLPYTDLYFDDITLIK
jgi:hypothetical protein